MSAAEQTPPVPMTQAEEKHPVLLSMPGPDKAAAFLLSLTDEYTKKLFDNLETHEVMVLSQRMASLGKIKADVIEALYVEFAELAGSGASLLGSYETTERLLRKFFSPDKVEEIMQEIRGPAGRTMWDKLGNVEENILAGYLQNEYPQTASVILSKIKPSHAAKVLAQMPDGAAFEIMSRMLKMEVVQRDILDTIEDSLRNEFMSNLVRTSQKDPHENMAEIFNSFDRATESRFMDALETQDSEAAERVRSLMFTFDDLVKLDSSGAQTLIRVVDKVKLALALKGAPESIKEIFLKNMSERAAKFLREDIAALGMVRLKDVDEAQQIIVNQTKELVQSGQIIISSGAEEEAMIE